MLDSRSHLARATFLALALVLVGAPLRADPGQGRPTTIELLVVDRAGKPLPKAKARFAVEDETIGMVDDPSVPGGKRRALRLDHPPIASSVDGHLKARREIPQGRVRIPWPEGRGLLASARYEDQWGYLWLPRDWRKAAGRDHPPGEPVRLVIFPDWDLRVSVVDERGRPVANVPVRLRSRPFGVAMTSGSASELVYRHAGFELRDATEPLEVWVDGPISPRVSATIDSKRAPAGPVTLRLPPTGSVEVNLIGPDGVSLSKCPISVGIRLATDAPPASERRFDDFETYHVRPTSEGKVRFHHVSLGREFEVFVHQEQGDRRKLRGPLGPGETVTATLDFRPQATDVVARPGLASPNPAPIGSLRGRLLLDPGVPPRAIELELREEWLGSRRAASRPLLGSDGTFRFSAVPIGPARLEAFTHGYLPKPDRRPVFQAPVEIAAGEKPDAGPYVIDLRGKVFAHPIMLQGLDRGRSLRAAVFFGPARQSHRSRVYLRTSDSPVVLVSPWEALDVEIRVPGHRDVSLLDLREPATVDLEPGLRVRLRLQTDGQLPKPPLYLKAALLPDERSNLGIDWDGPAFDERREIVLFAGKPGRARVAWIAAKHAGSGGGGGSSGWVRAQYVDVKDTPHEQVFEVALSAAELAEIMRQLR